MDKFVHFYLVAPLDFGSHLLASLALITILINDIELFHLLTISASNETTIVLHVLALMNHTDRRSHFMVMLSGYENFISKKTNKKFQLLAWQPTLTH